MRLLLQPNRNALTLVRDTYAGLFYDVVDCTFLDNLWANLNELDSPLKQSLAIAAACRACMKKRPRGLFTVIGQKGWDGRRDLKLGMREQFEFAVAALNSSVHSNGKRNRAFNVDVFELDPDGIDLVYLDPPYISPYSDCDYTRRYHFVDGNEITCRVRTDNENDRILLAFPDGTVLDENTGKPVKV